VYTQLLYTCLIRVIICNRISSIFISNSVEVSALTFVEQIVWIQNALAFILSLFATLTWLREVYCLLLAVNVNLAIVISTCNLTKFAVLEVLGVI
jgi:hypothetical protein